MLRGVFPAAVIERWRAQIWAATTADPADWPHGDFCGPTTSPLRGSGPRNTAIFTQEARKRLVYPFPDPTTAADPYPVSPAVGQEPHSRAVLDQLLGEGTWGSGIAAAPDPGAGLENDVVVYNWPQRADEAAAAAEPRHGKAHVEGFRPESKGGTVAQWLVGLTLYLDDCEPGGGGTVRPLSGGLLTLCRR